MTWIADLQKFIPWASDLPFVPKLLLSFIVVAVSAFALILIWTNQKEQKATQQPEATDQVPVSPNPPLKTRWEGKWHSHQGYRFSFVMHLDVGSDNTANGYILWRLLETPTLS